MSGSDDFSVRSHKLLGNFQVLELCLVKSQTWVDMRSWGSGSMLIRDCSLEIEEQFFTSPEQLNRGGLLLLTNTAQEMALLFRKTFSPPLFIFYYFLISSGDLVS